jgi:hypothetical protein
MQFGVGIAMTRQGERLARSFAPLERAYSTAKSPSCSVRRYS